MGFVLRKGLSFCRIDDRLVFLDIINDRYFALSQESHSDFETLCSNPATAQEAAMRLVDAGLGAIVAEPVAPMPCGVQLPTKDFWDLASSQTSDIPLTQRLLIRARLWRMKSRLRRAPLQSILSGIAPHRPDLGNLRRDIEDASPMIAAFEQAGHFTATDGDCLARTLTLSRRLNRAGLYPMVIFGVKLDPFAAHSWMQFGHLLVADELDRVSAYTPILAI